MPPGETLQAESLCAPFVFALPVQHAAISTTGDPFDVETVCASDRVAAELDEMQLDAGVGPCWSAKAKHAPVLIHDIDRHTPSDWPMLRAAASARGVRSAYAFPMSVGTMHVGVVDLYASAIDALSDADVAEAAAMADVAAIRVLRRALRDLEAEPDAHPSSRRTVHQATGMVVAQMSVTPENALLIIRAHAFASGATVREVAHEVIERRIDFSV